MAMNEFTRSVRRELVQTVPSSACCRRALLYGLLVNAECGIGGAVYAKFSADGAPELAVRLIRELYGREIEPTLSNAYGRKTAEAVIVSDKLSAALREISDPDHVSAELPFLKCRLCAGAFCAGLLLSAATFCDPDKGSRLEIRVSDPVTASRLTEFFSENDILPTLSGRNGNSSLLVKRSDDVERVLALSGANTATMELIQHKLVREFRGEVNRKSNCEVRNLSRAVDASAAHVEAIKVLRAAGMFDTLPDELQMTAALREAEPELTLAELAARHDPPISKSGLNHRLSKLLQAAEKYAAISGNKSGNKF
ncbi:MAG: DNA-binding protein WhiA [Clostridia bacterium]|nr:DNA-binding protein WhiA [Clostridia bacterium]